MISSPATANDFNKWESQAQKLSVHSLLYVIEDCKKAANAMRGWNPIREGFYADQAHTFSRELNKRRKGNA